MNPILQVDAQGNITYNGAPFLWASFFKRGTATQNPVDFKYMQFPVNDPFVFNGVSYPGGSYLMQDPSGKLSVISAEEFTAKYSDKGEI